MGVRKIIILSHPRGIVLFRKDRLLLDEKETTLYASINAVAICRKAFTVIYPEKSSL